MKPIRQEPREAMRLPLAVIDFEASGLDPMSYPIEAGVAVAPGSGAQIATWSTLIRPAPQWLETCGWDPDAQRIHGISRRDLRDAPTACEVAQMLNDRLAPIGKAFCDGGHYDALWLRVLFEAAGIDPAFTLRDIGHLFTLDPGAGRRYREIITRDKPPHRAGPDARRIAAALVEAMPA